MVLLDWGSTVLSDMLKGELSRLLLRMGHRVDDPEKLAELTRSLRALLPPELWQGESSCTFIATIHTEQGGPVSFCSTDGYLGGAQVAVKLEAGGDFALFGYEIGDGNLGYLVMILAERVGGRLKLVDFRGYPVKRGGVTAEGYGTWSAQQPIFRNRRKLGSRPSWIFSSMMSGQAPSSPKMMHFDMNVPFLKRP